MRLALVCALLKFDAVKTSVPAPLAVLFWIVPPLVVLLVLSPINTVRLLLAAPAVKFSVPP